MHYKYSIAKCLGALYETHFYSLYKDYDGFSKIISLHFRVLTDSNYDISNIGKGALYLLYDLYGKRTNVNIDKIL